MRIHRLLTARWRGSRDQRGLPTIETLVADVSHGLRALRANPAYTTAMLLTLTLGIGANAAMFTIVNAVILRPLPYADPDRLLSLSLRDSVDRRVVDERTYEAWLAARTVRLGAYRFQSGAIGLPTGLETVAGRRATASYFDVMGVRPALGRIFGPDEDRPGGPDAMVLSDQLWRRAFAADSSVIGRTVALDGRPMTVFGVMPASFTTASGPQFWVPYRMTASPSGRTLYHAAVGRLVPGATLAVAREELAALAQRAAQEWHQPAMSVVVQTLHDRWYGDARRPLLLIFAAVGLLLLIACANLATLSLARAARRQRELAVRTALGAGRGRLARLLLTESLLLAGGGALLGLALSVLVVRYVVHLSPQAVGNIERAPVDGLVLAFVIVIGVGTALVFGGAPALGTGRGDVQRALSNGNPRTAGSRRQLTVRRILVVTQMATALMLVVGAGLVARTLWKVTSISLGFQPERLLTASIELPRSRLQTAGPFFDALVERVGREPGVERAAITTVLPLGGRVMTTSVTDSSGNAGPPLDIVTVGPGYLETIGAHPVSGRLLSASDTKGAPPVVVITSTAARAFFGHGNAVGAMLPAAMAATVVGVIEDVRQVGIEDAITAVAYAPIAQLGGQLNVELVVRTNAAPTTVAPVVRQIVQDLDPTVAAPTFNTMERRLAEAAGPRRLVFVLFSLFAGLSVTLAIVGLAGLLSYLVAERTREIGVRLALGAGRPRVRRLILGHGLALTGIGLAIGLAMSLLSARVMQSLLYRGTVYDAEVFAGAVALLGLAAYAACIIPAVRASRVDAMTALRAE